MYLDVWDVYIQSLVFDTFDFFIHIDIYRKRELTAQGVNDAMFAVEVWCYLSSLSTQIIDKIGQ